MEASPHLFSEIVSPVCMHLARAWMSVVKETIVRTVVLCNFITKQTHVGGRLTFSFIFHH